MFTVVNHRLHKDGTPVPFRPTPNVGGALSPKFLVMHFTSGSYAGAVSWLCNPKAKASAHLVVGEDGEVTQLAPFNRVTWHAGRSFWKGINGLNSHSIGIEIANYGELTARSGKWFFNATEIPQSRVKVAQHANGGPRTGWHTYTPAQMDACLAIGQALHEAYSFQDVLGHDQIAPGRKVDPGPAFNMAAFRRSVIDGAGSLERERGDDRSVGGPKPLSQSRTMAGAGAGGFGFLGTMASDAATQVQFLADYSEALKWLFVALTVIGIGLVFYARWDDSRKGAK